MKHTMQLDAMIVFSFLWGNTVALFVCFSEPEIYPQCTETEGGAFSQVRMRETL